MSERLYLWLSGSAQASRAEEIFIAWMKTTPFFPGKLLKSNFVTFLGLVGLDFS